MPDALDGDFSRSRAVLIGTWDYRHLRPVPAAKHSLNRMTALLTSPVCGSWPEDRISIVDNRAALGDLQHELVTWFSSATDVALFYYVGHGQYDNDDRLCLSLTDSSDDPVLRTTTSLTFDAVRHAFRASKATTKIAILDCCFAELAASRDSTLAGPEVQASLRSPGAYLMMASGEFSTAWCQTITDNPQPQTYFTKYLVDVIERGIPGQPEGLTLGPIFETVADALVSDGKPEPKSRTSDHAAGYALARNATPLQAQADHDAKVTQLSAKLAKHKAKDGEQPKPRARRQRMMRISALVTATALTVAGAWGGWVWLSPLRKSNPPPPVNSSSSTTTPTASLTGHTGPVVASVATAGDCLHAEQTGRLDMQPCNSDPGTSGWSFEWLGTGPKGAYLKIHSPYGGNTCLGMNPDSDPANPAVGGWYCDANDDTSIWIMDPTGPNPHMLWNKWAMDQGPDRWPLQKLANRPNSPQYMTSYQDTSPSVWWNLR